MHRLAFTPRFAPVTRTVLRLTLPVLLIGAGACDDSRSPTAPEVEASAPEVQDGPSMAAGTNSRYGIRAHGRVRIPFGSAPQIDPGSKNIVSVKRINTGHYCIQLSSDITEADPMVIATPYLAGGGKVSILSKTACSTQGSGYRILLVTYNSSEAPTDYLGFTMMVP